MASEQTQADFLPTWLTWRGVVPMSHTHSLDSWRYKGTNGCRREWGPSPNLLSHQYFPPLCSRKRDIGITIQISHTVKSNQKVCFQNIFTHFKTNRFTPLSSKLFYLFHLILPSSGSSFAQVSAVSRLTIKRWLLLMLLQGFTVAEIGADDVTKGLEMTAE